MKSYLDFLHDLPSSSWLLEFRLSDFKLEIKVEKALFNQVLDIVQTINNRYDWIDISSSNDIRISITSSCDIYLIEYGKDKVGCYMNNCFFPRKKKSNLTIKFD